MALVHAAARGAASATGASGAASATGACSASVATSIDGKVKAGPFSVIALAWWNAKKQRTEMHAALVGDGKNPKKLKPNVWYQLDGAGKFVEVPDPV